MVWWHIVLIVVCSYLCGNISFSRIIAKTQHQDITKLGSGNPGSTNVMRNYGLKFGVLNLALDIIKAVVPCLTVYLTTGSIVYLYIAGLSVMLGHVFPVFFRFKGGKGIASMLGVFMVADPVATCIVMVCAFFCWLIFKYGSVSSFLCITALTVTEGIKAKVLPSPDRQIVCVILFVIFCLTWWAHRTNIKRLLLGKESKVDIIASAKKKIKNNTVGK
jgi:glycerol-3-phosphate acyltransferase PlsY